MNKVAKRFLAMVLSIVMIASYLPMDIFAAGNSRSGSTSRISAKTGTNSKKFKSDEDPMTNKELDELIKATADALFTGENDKSQIVLSVSRVADTGTSYKAGDVLKYRINYAFRAAPTFETGYDQAKTLFDSYSNNKISVELPAGLILQSASTGYSDYDDVVSPDGSHVYYFNIPDQDSSAGQFTFEVTVFVCGNGTENAIRSFDLDQAVTFSTEFAVKNKNSNEIVETYCQSRQATPGSFNTVSDDVWGVTKSVDESKTVIDRDSMRATVVYKIGVGMTGSNGSLITASSDYAVFGRSAFDKTAEGDPYVWLDDVLGDLIVGGAADGLIPEEESATIKKSNGTVEVPLGDGQHVVLKGDLALNTVKVDSDGDKLADQSVGSYTEYTVTVVYILTDEMIEHFENPQGVLNMTNEAELTYKLAYGITGSQLRPDDEGEALPLGRHGDEGGSGPFREGGRKRHGRDAGRAGSSVERLRGV